MFKPLHSTTLHSPELDVLVTLVLVVLDGTPQRFEALGLQWVPPEVDQVQPRSEPRDALTDAPKRTRK
jgi:hypothetical protein